MGHRLGSAVAIRRPRRRSNVKRHAVASDRILDLLRRPVVPDEVAEIRELWKVHSIAEDNRDLPGLIPTLTEDCVYTIAGTNARWGGHEGATRFYAELLTAFPDIHFELDYIVIGPARRLRGSDRHRHTRGPVAVYTDLMLPR